ncbi:venom protease-like [Neocloeon triangulifer]|uniref:venom protease-like n=1 Tax=Neocloeon triangulifer TaxID=2078957 RepID=UPI00286F8B45|nr:venom protease-like [Neocloeon triangulifer]
MAFARYVVFLSLATAVVAVSFPSLGTNHGDLCQLPDGAAAKCTLITDCPTGLKALKSRQPLPARCGFKGRVEIVCCPDLRITSKKPVISSTTSGHNTIKRSPIKVGAKSAEACQKYTKTAFPRIAVFITHGEEAGVGEFPHMVLLGYNYKSNSLNSGPTLTKGQNASWLCCGSLISERFVLTAAHCIEKEVPIVVRLGDLDWNSDDDGARPKEFGVSKVHLHPKFDSWPKLRHDIGLVELKTAVPFNWLMQPACLPSPEETLEGSNQDLIVTGWGDTEFAALAATSMLMKAKLKPVPFRICNETFAKSLEGGIKAEGQMCAFDPKGLSDACRGDSGGPLQLKMRNSQLFKVVGVTSGGRGCGGRPGLYTRVSGYIEWIESIVWPTK